MSERSGAETGAADVAPGARVAIVTGAAGALGTAMCERFVRDGVRVVVADLVLESAEQVARRLDPPGNVALAVSLDVTSYASVEAMVTATLEWAGRIDILVNNAGVSEGLMSTWEMPLETWHRTIDVDLTGVFHGCRAVLPTMLERGWGRIVNISSIAGKEGKHNPVAYASAKAGVIGLTKALAFEVAERGILVNAITPGSIMTRNWSHLPEAEIDAVRQRHPIGRLGRAEEVAAMVAWLSSDECSFSSGAVFDISGGRAGH
jgi:NAD(P)-dependent dehydrogenase (short-subunit alcohol dehydrogenase family)